MSHLPSDLTLARRTLMRRPGATLLIVLSLSVTIGVSAAAFSVIDAIMWRGLPVRDRSQLVWVNIRDQQGRLDSLTWIEYEAVARRVPGLSGTLAQTRHTAAVKVGDHIEYLLITAVSDNYFDLLGVEAGRGALFQGGAGRDGEVVVSDRFWQRQLVGDPAVVGRMLRVGRTELRIIGVLPPGFQGLVRGVAGDLYVPSQTAFGSLGYRSPTDRRNTDFEVLGRLRTGARTEEVQRDAARALRQVDADGLSPASGRSADVSQFDRSGFRSQPRTSALFLGIVVLVLLVAAANVANMRLAQNEERRAEVAIRVALGAGRWALWRQQLAEMLLLAAVGTAGAFIVASWLVDLVPSLLYAGERYRDFGIRMDYRAFCWTTGAMVLVTFVGAVVPFRDTARVISSSGLSGRTMTTRSRWLPSLVVLQVGLVTGIIGVTGVLWQSLANLSAIRPAMDPDRALVLVQGYFDSDGPTTALADVLAGKLEAVPGIRSVAYARRAMLSGSGGGAKVPIEFGSEKNLTFRYNQVSPGYFHVTGARVLSGRGFVAADGPEATPVVMVNEAFVRRFFADGSSPIGAWVGAAGKTRQIVGVVEDGPVNHLRESLAPFLYFPFAQHPSGSLTLFVTTDQDPGDAIPALRRYLTQSAPDFRAFEVTPLSGLMRSAKITETMSAGLAGGLAVLALLLASGGLYGVTLFAVSRRVREFGVRVALGATRVALGRQVLGDAGRMVAFGLLAGWGVALGGYQLIRTQLFGVASLPAWSLVAATAIVVGVSLLAALQPALRASRIDPVEALRQQ